jgi:protein phosphatase
MLSRVDIEVIARTHPGLVREVNEDRHYVAWLDEHALLMAVVDGMGGGPAGSAAAETVRQALTSITAETPDPEQALAEVLVLASEAIGEYAEGKQILEGMGATVTATYLCNGMAYWVHVGDTRLYIFRRGRLIQVTTDQTMAQLLVEEGRISADEARTHPYGQLLDQCVGCPMCEPVTGSLALESGDLLLHSTDGLHDALSEKDIIAILTSSHPTVGDTAEALLQAALVASGQDNITLVLSTV